ncbi:serine hydrolase [Lacticaseibacillus pabuli]|uniref:serine-type D-Ala-D-Ala carboxypeptidase n=1 Tax=Lacticaseibacillus pabuli TaxID=3025672 RepID=A0ABY7WSZ4_9LACO|nr:serine hydrolase [Lacticaseibacillus sp. KACC 23028]WDF82553.1 serine hydrolase [Lacticaseibacillus sp. KACC 23028]
MKKFFKAAVAFLAALTIGSAVLPASQAAAATSVTDSLNVNAKAAISVDAKTGKILYAKNANQVLPIASMSKLITVYLLLDAVKTGKVKWTDRIRPDKEIVAISQRHDLSNVPLRSDKTYTVRELYQATLIYSANAAAMMLGDIVTGGSENKFIDLMNAQVKKWGITNANFVNANGLNNAQLGKYIYPGSGKHGENVMTARDMAIVARHLLKDFPEVLETTSIAKKTFEAGTNDATDMPNWNFMLPGEVAAQPDLHVDGLKTGTTDTAGDCFTGTATQNGQRIITVILHTGGQGETKRFVQTAKLMRWTFANWKPMTILPAGSSVKGESVIKVDKGKQETVALKTKKAITTVVPVNTAKSGVQLTYNKKVDELKAPAKKGTKTGTLKASVPGDDLGYLGQDGSSTAVVTTARVDKAGFFRLIGRGIKEFFTNLF